MAQTHSTNLHSRVVAWVKVILPLLALAILSTLFLVARTVNPEDAIPYADVDVADRIREPRMTGPTFAGVTADGASITLVAEAARPATDQSRATADSLTATLETPDGAQTTFTAAHGALDAENQRLDLTGGVQITTPQGFHITTAALSAALDRTDVSSSGTVKATGPLGSLDAGKLALTGENGRYHLLFQNGVNLLYLPPVQK